MAYTVARVEIHGMLGGAPAYERLHRAMDQVGFSRIMPADGKNWMLPTGTYFSARFPTKFAACTAATQAARSVATQVSIVVTEGGSTFEGLQQVP